MPKVKMGLSQIENPAPLAYRRFSNAMIMFIIPGLATLIAGWGLPDLIANRWLLLLSFIPALIKGIGVLLGNGQEYAPSGTQARAYRKGVSSPNATNTETFGDPTTGGPGGNNPPKKPPLP